MISFKRGNQKVFKKTPVSIGFKDREGRRKHG